jgi:large subunit ribosomal protein L9
MAIEMVLIESVKGLGEQGDIVRVAEGYARNYLVPHNLAAPATDATRRRIEKLKKVAEARRSQDRDAAVAQVKLLEAATVSITMKAGEGGKLYGSVTSLDIVEALRKQGLTVDKHQLELPEPLRELGVFKVPVKLLPDVQAEIKVWVVQE